MAAALSAQGVLLLVIRTGKRGEKMTLQDNFLRIDAQDRILQALTYILVTHLAHLTQI